MAHNDFFYFLSLRETKQLPKHIINNVLLTEKHSREMETRDLSILICKGHLVKLTKFENI